MRNRSVITFISGALIAASSLAQTVPAPQATATAAPVNLTFDVASVKPAAPIDQATMMAGLRAGKRPESVRLEGLRATYTYMSLKELIAYGYKLRTYQVSGPDWLTTDRFDIAAKMPEGSSKDDVPAMLQALLIERFKLAAHLETAEHPVLGLMLAKGGGKLREATEVTQPFDDTTPLKPGESQVDSVDGPIRLLRNSDGSTTYNMGARGTFTLIVDGQNGTMHLKADSMTMKGLAAMLTSLGGGNGRQVVDMTGLTGKYQLEAAFSLSDLVNSLRDQGITIPTGPSGGPGAPSMSASDPGGDSTVSDALAKQGLKLEKSKAMVEQLVVDHVEKAATAN